MERTGLINMIKIKVDEYTPETVTLPFESYLNPVIDECCKVIQSDAPLRVLLVEDAVDSVAKFNACGYAGNKFFVPLPTSYVRFVSAMLPEWSKAVRYITMPGTPEYAIQENEYTRSGYGRPSVVMDKVSFTNFTGTKALDTCLVLAKAAERSAADATSDINASVLYVKEQSVDDLSEELMESLSWLAAHRIMTINNLDKQAQVLGELYAGALKRL